MTGLLTPTPAPASVGAPAQAASAVTPANAAVRPTGSTHRQPNGPAVATGRSSTPLGSPLAEAHLTDLTRGGYETGGFEAKDAGLVGFKARYDLTEPIVHAGKQISLPALSVARDNPALEGLPNPANGWFAAFAAPTDTVKWVPDARQVGGLYFAPKLERYHYQTVAYKPQADVAGPGDRVDFGVVHFDLEAGFPQADPAAPATGQPVWELASPFQTVLEASYDGGRNQTYLGARTGYLHVQGSNPERSEQLNANGLSVEPLRVPLPSGPYDPQSVFYLVGVVTRNGTSVQASVSYDAAGHQLVVGIKLNGAFPESGVLASGLRTDVVGVVAFAWASDCYLGDCPESGLTDNPLGQALSFSVPSGARGSLVSGAAGRSPGLDKRVSPGQTVSLALGAAGIARTGNGSVAATAAGSGCCLGGEAGSLSEVEGTHTSTNGKIRFELVHDLRGAPAVVAPRRQDDGARLADAIQVPYAVVDGEARPLSATDVVDARFFPAAWTRSSQVRYDWIPGLATAYHQGRPMPYVVATSTAYGPGATLDLVYDLGSSRFLIAEFVFSENEVAGVYRAEANVTLDLLGEQSPGAHNLGAVLVATSGSGATASVTPLDGISSSAAAPLPTEAALRGGPSTPRALYPAMHMAVVEVQVATGSGTQSVRPLEPDTDSVNTFVLNAASRLPVPASTELLPPEPLLTEAGLDVVVEGPGIRLRLGMPPSTDPEPSPSPEDSTTALIVEGKSNSKTLEARLSDLDSPFDGIAGRTIAFYSDSEPIGSTQTDQDGVATIAVPPGHRGANRTYEAVFSGDDFYRASSDARPGQGGGQSNASAPRYQTARTQLGWVVPL